MVRGVCKIDGCGRLLESRGLCTRHYLKLRKYGDPLAGALRHDYGDLARFIERACAYTGDECLLWPFSKLPNSYGTFTYGNRTRTAHSVVCERVHGKAPKGRKDATHTCGKRACVAPRHLVWKSRAENMADHLVHGTRARGEKQGNSKLTAEDVVAIRALSASVSQDDLAERYGVCRSQISHIVTRQQWRHIP